LEERKGNIKNCEKSRKIEPIRFDLVLMYAAGVINIFFLAVKLSDTGADKLTLIRNVPNYWQQGQSSHSINESALNSELQSIILNIE
jgi:hypothetical protein